MKKSLVILCALLVSASVLSGDAATRAIQISPPKLSGIRRKQAATFTLSDVKLFTPHGKLTV